MSAITSVAVFGGTGFVGREIVRALLAKGYAVRVLARERAKARRVLPDDHRLTIIQGSIDDHARVDETLGGAQACINLLGILREVRSPENTQTFQKLHTQATRHLVARSEALGITRFVQMSALGVRDTGVSEYQRSKWEAEQAVRFSGLRWTILRPGLIHGPGSEFARLAKTWCTGHHAPWFFLPYFCREVEDKRVPLGPVSHVDPVVAPIAVEDVAEAFVGCLENAASVGETYHLTGPETLTWPEMLRHMRDNFHGSNFELEPHAIPGNIAAMIAKGASLAGLGGLLPFDEGMARMGAEDSVSEHHKVRHDLGLNTRPFRPSFAAYAPQI